MGEGVSITQVIFIRVTCHAFHPSEIGAGGRGVVLLARQESLDRLAVLKRTHPDYDGDAELEARFAEALELGAHPFEARLNLAALAMRGGDLDDAERLLGDIDAPDDPRVQRARGRLLVRQGAHRQALELLEPLSEDPQLASAELWHDLATSHLALEAPRQALQALSRARRLGASRKRT